MDATDQQEMTSCPLAGVDRRLEDVHRHWHQAEEAYFNPEPFRIAIQTAIQALRTVTFILQSNKDKIPEFKSWYGHWQIDLKADPLMRWMVDARNKIEKQGDLEVHSFVRAEVIASHLSGEVPAIEVPAHLFDDPLSIIGGLPPGDLLDHFVKHGTLRIQRRWVENTLPDYEFLDAVAVAYGRIAQIVHDAHRQMGLDMPTATKLEPGQRYAVDSREGRLPCMIGHADARSLDFNLSDGSPLEFERITKRIDEDDAEKIIERYGDIHKGMLGSENSSEAEIAENLFSTARKVFEKDGYHQSLFFLFNEGRLVHLLGIQPENQAEKYLLMRTVAHEVTIYGADTVIGLGEVWRARVDLLKPYQRPADSPTREEALVANMVSKNGKPMSLSAPIHRDDENATLGETHVFHDHAPFLFSSVYEAWGRPIPHQWNTQMENLALASGSFEP